MYVCAHAICVICICMNTCIHVCVCLCLYPSAPLNLLSRRLTCSVNCLNTSLYIYVCVCMYTYVDDTCTYVHVYVYVCMYLGRHTIHLRHQHAFAHKAIHISTQNIQMYVHKPTETYTHMLVTTVS
jgi:hypothetical protein